MNDFLLKLQSATIRCKQRHAACQFYLVLRSGMGWMRFLACLPSGRFLALTLRPKFSMLGFGYGLIGGFWVWSTARPYYNCSAKPILFSKLQFF